MGSVLNVYYYFNCGSMHQDANWYISIVSQLSFDCISFRCLSDINFDVFSMIFQEYFDALCVSIGIEQ